MAKRALELAEHEQALEMLIAINGVFGVESRLLPPKSSTCVSDVVGDDGGVSEMTDGERIGAGEPVASLDNGK